MLYQKLIRPTLFKLDPEWIHNLASFGLRITSQSPLRSNITRYCKIDDPILKTNIASIKLDNPVGLAAGFDKNIVAPLAYQMLGFGLAELGSVTQKAQPGNPKPRLWRLPKDQGIIVHYGLYNDGATAIKQRLEKARSRRTIPWGVSIAPTTGIAPESMIDDYLASLGQLAPVADYITLNVSCPNVHDCNLFSATEFVEQLIRAVGQFLNQQQLTTPVFVKIGPNGSTTDLERITRVVLEQRLAGVVATNLTKDRRQLDHSQSSAAELNHPGGISGRLVRNLSTETIRQLWRISNGQLNIVGNGGVFTGADAYEKIRAGARAVQIITGFIYNGPLAVRRINRELAMLLRRDGFNSIAEAVGIDAKKQF